MANGDHVPEPGSEEPPWPRLAVLTVAFGVLMLPLAFTSVSLYWYAFPLFGLGVVYVLQFRAEFPMAWRVTLVVAAVVSAVALALNWPGCLILLSVRLVRTVAIRSVVWLMNCLPPSGWLPNEVPAAG